MNDWDPFYSLYSPPRPLEKTPYQLDLEVKDRKPDIVPKVGDKVKIKSWEWYEKWKNPAGDVQVLYSFIKDMAKHCGRVLTVKEVSFGSRDWKFILEEDEEERNWSLAMFEEVYTQISASALGTQLTGTSAIPAINSVQEIGIPTDWSKLVSDTAAIITLPQQSLFCNAGFNRQSVLQRPLPCGTGQRS